MSFMDKIKDVAATGLMFGWTGIKKAPSATWWLLTKSPKLFRRGFQLAAIYFGSLAAEKVLDEAHEKLPDNEFVAKADTLIHAAVNAENFLIGGASSIAKSAYDAAPSAKAAPMSAEPAPATRDNDTPKQPVSFEPVTDAGKLETESVKQAQLAMPPAPFANIQSEQTALPPPALPLAGEAPPREAAFMPVEPAERIRANLNTTIPAPAQQAPAPVSIPVQAVTCIVPAAPILGPDGLPIDGGYDPKTGITWGPYMKPYTGPRPPIKPDFKP